MNELSPDRHFVRDSSTRFDLSTVSVCWDAANCATKPEVADSERSATSGERLRAPNCCSCGSSDCVEDPRSGFADPTSYTFDRGPRQKPEIRTRYSNKFLLIV